jgi:sugar (pentulose or hexulose) kinase
MVATNSIKVRTGNVSAGTSIFSMVVLEKALSRVYTQIDMVTTPAGKPVAMVHCNNCTGDIDAWVRLFGELLGEAGADIPKSKLYDLLYFKALEGDKDCGGVVSFNYISGEPVSDLTEGRPLMLRTPDAKFNLANFMRNELYSAFAALKNGNDLLFKNEGVSLDSISGHGGIYKTEGVGAKITAAALNTKVTVMKTAGEGGPWGMAILAAYMLNKCEGETLDSYLENRVFANAESTTVEPDEADVKGFEEYMKLYNKALAVEKAAVENV